MKKVRKSGLIAVLIGLMAGPWVPCFGAASGNYTDLLPIGAAGNTTLISNGTGWSLTTLPPTQTFGDALSRVVTTVYQSTQAYIINTAATSTFTATAITGGVGSTTFPAAWVASGRSIRTTIEGEFTTANPPPNWTWQLKLSTTAILTTGAMAAPGGQTAQHFKAISVITIDATGASGTASGNYQILVSSGASVTGAGVVSFSTSALTSVDWTSQLVVNPTFLWSATGSSITVRNATVEFLN